MGDDTITVVRYAERYVAPEVASWEVALEGTDREAPCPWSPPIYGHRSRHRRLRLRGLSPPI